MHTVIEDVSDCSPAVARALVRFHVRLAQLAPYRSPPPLPPPTSAAELARAAGAPLRC